MDEIISQVPPSKQTFSFLPKTHSLAVTHGQTTNIATYMFADILTELKNSTWLNEKKGSHRFFFEECISVIRTYSSEKKTRKRTLSKKALNQVLDVTHKKNQPSK